MTRTTDRIATLTALALMLSGLLVACGGPDSVLDESDAVALAKPTDSGLPSDPGTPTDIGGMPTGVTMPTDAGAPTPAVPSVKAAFAAELPAGTYKALKHASIADDAAVWVVADWAGVTADTSERITLVSPSGAVYLATSIPFEDASDSIVTSWTLPDGTRRIAMKLLIWGTTIEEYWQVGTWTATVATADGSMTASAKLNLK